MQLPLCGVVTAADFVLGTSRGTLLLLLLPPLFSLQLATGLTSKIFQHYVLKQRIGAGSWGEVFVAIERLSGIQRAVKRIPKRHAAFAASAVAAISVVATCCYVRIP